MPALTSFGNSEETGTSPIRILRNRSSREWLVEDKGVSICSLIVTDISPKKWLLKSEAGNWDVVALGGSRLHASRVSGEPKQAEIRAGVNQPGIFREDAEAISDLYIDLRTYKRVVIGTGWKVVLQNQEVLRYIRTWKVSDLSSGVCYCIWPKIQIPNQHRDLLLAMPLFWSGMPD